MNPHTRNIISDTIVLIACSSVLGALSYIVTKTFSADDNPALHLITVMKKAESRELGAETLADAEMARKDGMKNFEIEIQNAQGKILSGEAFVNAVDSLGRTPIMWVCYANNNNLETTKNLEIRRSPYLQCLLKDNRVEINKKDNDGWTALHWAAWSGLDSLSTLLIEKQADINIAENNGYTPLMLAAMRGNAPVVELLLKNGADINAVNKDKQNSLQLATTGFTSYKKSFDMSKTHVAKMNAKLFLTAFEKAVAECPITQKENVINLAKAQISTAPFVSVSSTLKTICMELQSKGLISADDAKTISTQVSAASSEPNATQDIDVRAHAFEETIKLLEKASKA
ncbi:MAG: ankyrin repeat domain-containing protein [Akkermansia sp.]|nr:ankyrin repeat domain-containing protein [Akkermansia sp.]